MERRPPWKPAKVAWCALGQTPTVFWREARSVRLFPMARPFPFPFPIGIRTPTPSAVVAATLHTPFIFPFFVCRGCGTAASARIRNALLQVLLHVRHLISNFGFQSTSEADPRKSHCLQFLIQLQGFLTLPNQDRFRLRIKRRLQDPLENPFPLEHFVPSPRILEPRARVLDHP
jgi:hypothetical protein